MLFSVKSKAFFIDYSEHAILVARTSSATAPMVVEDIRECAPDDEAALAEILKSLQIKKSQSGYLHATCGVYTNKRVVRKVTLEPKRVKESGYLNEVAQQQVRIEPEQYTLAVLNASDGAEYDTSKATVKEAVFCGMPSEQINKTQDRLLSAGVYSERIEIGTASTVGALVDYLAFAKIKTPTLMLEIDADTAHSFIVSAAGMETSRQIPHGLDSIVPVVQKELGLKDEESARKLFFSNTFDFTGMGPVLIKKLVKELQSSIGFYEVQTGQSIGQVICTLLPPKLGWLESAIAGQLGVSVLKVDLPAWLQSRQITLSDSLPAHAQDVRRLGLFSLMVQYSSHVAAPEKK